MNGHEGGGAREHDLRHERKIPVPDTGAPTPRPAGHYAVVTKGGVGTARRSARNLINRESVPYTIPHASYTLARLERPADPLVDEGPVLAALTAASVRETIATGERAGSAFDPP